MAEAGRLATTGERDSRPPSGCSNRARIAFESCSIFFESRLHRGSVSLRPWRTLSVCASPLLWGQHAAGAWCCCRKPIGSGRRLSPLGRRGREAAQTQTHACLPECSHAGTRPDDQRRSDAYGRGLSDSGAHQLARAPGCRRGPTWLAVPSTRLGVSTAGGRPHQCGPFARAAAAAGRRNDKSSPISYLKNPGNSAVAFSYLFIHKKTRRMFLQWSLGIPGPAATRHSASSGVTSAAVSPAGADERAAGSGPAEPGPAPGAVGHAAAGDAGSQAGAGGSNASAAGPHAADGRQADERRPGERAGERERHAGAAGAHRRQRARRSAGGGDGGRWRGRGGARRGDGAQPAGPAHAGGGAARRPGERSQRGSRRGLGFLWPGQAKGWSGACRGSAHPSVQRLWLLHGVPVAPAWGSRGSVVLHTCSFPVASLLLWLPCADARRALAAAGVPAGGSPQPAVSPGPG